ncbi:N-acetyltransferase [Nonomuraea rhizosphaerae]|uniref:N-acetyltransferase n=1 Tax=Nonomuraea rhizosphaerae TaxID=2665663 RepID=UPI001FE7B06E|nr:N-acetyltransferase [Nonomuraea rhizosphaerae]
MSLRITTLAERPSFEPALWDMEHSWSTFMFQDPIADLFYPVAATEYADYVLVADDSGEPGRLAARGCMIPFPSGGDGLPDDGWDGVIRRGWLGRARNGSAARGAVSPDAASPDAASPDAASPDAASPDAASPDAASPDAASPDAASAQDSAVMLDAVSALEITVRRDLLGSGVSPAMVAAMRDHAARLGFRELVAPVRPTQKHLEPHTPMSEYAFRTREDGLPSDAWLRVHVRAGARIVKVAPRSMVVAGTLEEWREWTGLPFDRPGPVEVPGALVPVHCDVAHGHAVYVEPNVWVSHPLT